MAERAILIVCQGNTCRSPMAEVIAKRLLQTKAHIESAGIAASDSFPATKDAIKTMSEMGLDLREHRSRDIGALELSNFTTFIAMTPLIAKELAKMGVDHGKILELNVPDPYGRGVEEYRATALKIEDELRSAFGSVQQDEQ